MIPFVMLAYIGVALDAPVWFWVLYIIEAATVCYKYIREWRADP